MSATIWVLKQGQEEDDYDHSFLLIHMEYLDQLCKKKNVEKLSDFYDYSEYNDEFGLESIEKNYLDINLAKTTLQALIEQVSKEEIKNKIELLEELDDCLKKLNLAQQEKCKVRFVYVM